MFIVHIGLRRHVSTWPARYDAN